MNVLQRLQNKRLERWLGRWATQAVGQRLRRVAENRTLGSRPRHLLFAFCDHYEPLWGRRVGRDRRRARARAGIEGYPQLGAAVSRRRRPPPAPLVLLSRASSTARRTSTRSAVWRAAGFGEVELHLHHDGDTAERAARTLARVSRQRTRSTAIFRAARTAGCATPFIHGNWCLANARRDGRWCGVDDELRCCSRPAATPTSRSRPRPTSPSPASSTRSTGRTAISVARGRTNEDVGPRRRAHARPHPDDRGPARADSARRWARACASRTRRSPRTIRRRRSALRTWVAQDIHVAGRPEWVFVKVHTHGAPEPQAADAARRGRSRAASRAHARYNDGSDWVASLRDRARDVQRRPRRHGGRMGNPRRLSRLRYFHPHRYATC